MKKLLILVTLMVIGIGAYAQIESPVKWSYAAKKLSNTEAVVFLKATIQDGWHIYSQNVKDGGPIKTSFTFLPSKEYSLVGKTAEPAPTSKYEDAFKMNVSYFENAVIFRQMVKLVKGTATIKGTVRFMVCNDRQCLPPENVSFSIPVN